MAGRPWIPRVAVASCALLIAATPGMMATPIAATSMGPARADATASEIATRGDGPTPPRVDRFIASEVDIPWSFAPSAAAVRRATGLQVVPSGRSRAQVAGAKFATVDYRADSFGTPVGGINQVTAGIASARSMRGLVRLYREAAWKVLKKSGWNYVMTLRTDLAPNFTEVIAMRPAHGYVATGQCQWYDEDQSRPVNQRRLVTCANSVARLVVQRPV
jgi:hypothetical protein